MAESERLMGRNGSIWREYVRGATQEALAAKYGVSQPTVAAAIAYVRDSIPQQERAELVAQEVDYLRQVRSEAMQLWDAVAAPVTAGKDGEVVRDPEHGDAVVRDHSGRIAGARLALDISRHLARLTGLEASQKVEISTGEEPASQRAAAEAAAYLHGGTPPEEA